jgi:hypothetical protein
MDWDAQTLAQGESSGFCFSSMVLWRISARPAHPIRVRCRCQLGKLRFLDDADAVLLQQRDSCAGGGVGLAAERAVVDEGALMAFT